LFLRLSGHQILIPALKKDFETLKTEK